MIHLGLIGFIGDESIRTLVAFEMHKSSNFLVPTLNGELYFNKPPLYNWLIYAISMLFGSFGEWPTRLTTLLCLAGFCAAIYHFNRQQQDRVMALAVMVMTLTCGRILFWDSMLGLIDIGFSAVVYINFMLMYRLGSTGRWQSLFIWSYLLFSLAFLLKGLPAVVFQGLSLLATLWFFNALRRQVFSKQHVIGIALGILPVVLYYLLYAQQVSLADVFATLSDQSLQRTATHHGIRKTVIHLFTFPVEQLYHFLPWSLVLLMMLHSRSREWIRENAFVRFNLLMIAVNLPVYWLSVQVYPRYLIMFVPLFFTIGYFLLARSREEHLRWWRIAHGFFVIVAAMAFAVLLVLPFVPQLKDVPGLYWKWILTCILMLLAVMALQSDKVRMMVWMGCVLLVVRIGFNCFVLPVRATESRENVTRADAKLLSAMHGDTDWLIYGETELHEVARGYTSLYKNAIIRKTASIDPQREAYYLVDRKLYPDFPGIQLDSLTLERGEQIALMRVR
jgi:4-amino-4-deoxy-L-arabinose transferase-like glycosyltransferase